jgi:hypothetical protein
MIAVAVAFFDAVFMDHPLLKAGMTNANDRHIWIVGIALVIAGAVHAGGIYGGRLGLGLSRRDHRKAAMLAVIAILGLLCIGLVLLGVMRHEWTAHANNAFRDGAHSKPTIPAYLDLWFLTPIQVAGALGAAALLALYVMGGRGRKIRKDLAKAERLLTTYEKDLRDVEYDIAVRVPNEMEKAALEVHDTRVDAAKAEVEVESFEAETAAEIEAEENLTDAAVNRYRVTYEGTDKQYDNGNSRLVRNPDGLARHWRPDAVDDVPEQDGDATSAELHQLLLDLHDKG